MLLQECIENLPKRRKLNVEETAEVTSMLEMHADKWLIKRHILQQTGMHELVTYAHNLC